MINFKNQQDVAPSVAILCAIVILAGTLIYNFVVPVPNSAKRVKTNSATISKMSGDIVKVKRQEVALAQQVKARVWTEKPDAITAHILERVTTLSKQYTLGVTTFRPQKIQLLDGVTELPYNIIVTGGFGAVQKMARDLEYSADGKLALRSLQFASGDAATSAVSATLNVSAFIETPEAPSSASKTGAKQL